MTRRARLAGSSVPILLLAQGEDVANGVAALDAGADQWLAAPFAVEELLARLRALLTRTSSGSGELLRFSDLELDPHRREVRRTGAPMALTRTEFLLLRLFLLNPGRVLMRHEIHSRVWGYDFRGASDTLRVHIGGLRRKLEAGGRPRLIHTARGVGYALREP